ncbi:hypothetical protein DFH28DRAFT_1130980 [Melampsora americana]|nr:hypothetical protein DFH28DRAFT_1130980 [Melampsora americana]
MGHSTSRYDGGLLNREDLCPKENNSSSSVYPSKEDTRFLRREDNILSHNTIEATPTLCVSRELVSPTLSSFQQEMVKISSSPVAGSSQKTTPPNPPRHPNLCIPTNKSNFKTFINHGVELFQNWLKAELRRGSKKTTKDKQRKKNNNKS